MSGRTQVEHEGRGAIVTPYAAGGVPQGVRAPATRTIDLNADMGEGFGRYTLGADGALVELVTSANVACGFHAGDPRVMDATVRQASARGVRVGAHVSYPDLVGFGRRHLEVSSEELTTDVLVQLGALDAICRRYGTSVRYVKAHGALYNDLASNPDLARAFAEAVRAYHASLPVLMLAGSAGAEALAAEGIVVRTEGFPDRAYAADGTLVARREAGAVIDAPETVARRGVQMALGEPFDSRTGVPVTCRVDSLCLHGDTPGVVAIARALRSALEEAQVVLRAFS
jgi:UPF0271 protein